MATETVIQRESPDIEALKLGMLKQGKILADKPPEGIEDPTPDLTLAAQDERSLTARTMADNASGDYAPYLQDANTTLNAGIGTLNVGGEAADTLTQCVRSRECPSIYGSVSNPCYRCGFNRFARSIRLPTG